MTLTVTLQDGPVLTITLGGSINTTIIESTAKEGVVESTEIGVPIVFDEPFAEGTTYALKVTCYDAEGYSTPYRITNLTITGFTAQSSVPATFIYETITY